MVFFTAETGAVPGKGIEEVAFGAFVALVAVGDNFVVDSRGVFAIGKVFDASVSLKVKEVARVTMRAVPVGVAELAVRNDFRAEVALFDGLIEGGVKVDGPGSVT